ncbi:hypothetical protein F0U62_36735 [Cystobacter fuscus]|uniref:hypothetical protein n=1 Tax=Cystobacter fuscus TaxID=43 RepID=UPI002B2A6F2C|nr:hypothetical protein F0U62_36735 [Cystobacter fuscus]
MASTVSGCGFGSSSTPRCVVAVSRHLVTGALDPTFGEAGIATAEFGTSLRLTGSRVKLLVDGTGRVSLVVPYWVSGTYGSFYGVQRWEANGTPVAGFGTKGNVAFQLPSGEQRFDQLREAVQRKDGTVFIAATLFDSTSQGYSH